jgi:hypothetical protein
MTTTIPIIGNIGACGQTAPFRLRIGWRGAGMKGYNADMFNALFVVALMMAPVNRPVEEFATAAGAV